MWSSLRRSATWWLMYSLPLSAWKAWTGEGEGGDEVLQHEHHEVLGDARHGAKVLELRDFVDDVDEVDALFAAPVAEVYGVDAQEAGLAIGLGLAADADGDGSRAGLAEGEAAGPVLAGLPEVVDLAVGDVGEALEPLVAVDMAHAPEDHLGGGSGELAEGLVDLGQQRGVIGRVAARKGLGGGLLAMVADVAGPAVLPDEAGDLGPGEARHLLQEPLDPGLVRPPEAVVLEADQRAPHEGVGGSAVSGLEVRGLIAFEEGAELVEGAYPFGAKCHDHPPMISSPRTSGSSLAGNRPRVRACRWTRLVLALWMEECNNAGGERRVGESNPRRDVIVAPWDAKPL